MFETQRAKRIRDLLFKIDPQFAQEKHCVLRAYLTKIMPSASQTYTFKIPEGMKEQWNEILDYLPMKGRLDELLNDFAPLEVLDTQAILREFNASLRTQESILFNILIVKSFVFFPITKRGKRDLWQEYKDRVQLEAKEVVKTLKTSQEFYSFLSAIYSLDLTKSTIGLDKRITKDIREITNILFEDFRCGRQQSVEICAAILAGNEVGDFDASDDNTWFFEEQNDYGPTNFSACSLRDSQSNNIRREKYNELVEKVSCIKDPWDLFTALWITKRKDYDIDADGNKISARGDYIKNSIAIENSVVERIFNSQSFTFERQEKVLIVLPSPFFMSACATSPTKIIPADIVVESESYKTFYEWHFKISNAIAREKLKFISLDEFTNSANEERVYTSVLFFENHIYAPRKSEKWKSILDKVFSVGANDIYVLGKDNEIHKSWTLFQRLLGAEIADIKDIVLFSEKLSTDNENSKKYFLHATINGSQQGFVDFYTGPARRKRKNPNETQEDSFYEPHKLYLDFESPKKKYGISKLREGTQTLREFFNENGSVKLYSRADAQTLHFSDEIVFQYTQSEVYALKGIEYRFTSKEERIIKGTKVRIPKKLRGNSSAVRDWIQNKYPFINRQLTNIRESIATYFKQNCIGCNLTFRTFWYLYPDLEEKISEQFGNEVRIFLKEVAFSEFGNKLINAISLEDLENYLSSLDVLRLQLPKSEIFKVFMLMFTEAKELRHCDANIFVPDENQEDVKDLSQKSMREIASALKIKTATYDQLKTIFHKIRELINKDQKSGYALLLRFMTGLDGKIICALRWEDFIYNEDFDFFYLRIYKRISVNNREQKLDSLSSFRLYPCSPYLAKRLLQLKNSVQKIAGESTLKDRYILCENNEENIPFDYTRLPSLWNKIARSSKCEDFIISIPDYNKEGYVSKNLSDYKGDFLKENIKYWFLQKVGMVPDEINYLLGYKCHSTFYAHYCDLLNPASLYKLYQKLARFDSILLYDKAPHFEDYTLDKATKNQFSLQSQNPLLLELSIEAPEDVSKIELNITSSFGSTVSSKKMPKVEDCNGSEI